MPKLNGRGGSSPPSDTHHDCSITASSDGIFLTTTTPVYGFFGHTLDANRDSRVQIDGYRVEVTVGVLADEGATLLRLFFAGHRLAPLATDGDATRGGDGSAIELGPLSRQEIEAAALAGELGCSFSAEAGHAPLLLAMGHVASKEPARGVVKVGDDVEPVAAPGGFDAMLRGARFTGCGTTRREESTTTRGTAPRSDVQQSGVRVGPDQRYRRVVAD